VAYNPTLRSGGYLFSKATAASVPNNVYPRDADFRLQGEELDSRPVNCGAACAAGAARVNYCGQGGRGTRGPLASFHKRRDHGLRVPYRDGVGVLGVIGDGGKPGAAIDLGGRDQPGPAAMRARSYGFATAKNQDWAGGPWPHLHNAPGSRPIFHEPFAKGQLHGARVLIRFPTDASRTRSVRRALRGFHNRV